MDIHAHRILILDFGSQYTQLIARRIREIGVYCEIHPWDVEPGFITSFAPHGIILSGGPESVTADTGPTVSEEVFSLQVPVLGICYGMQAIAKYFGGDIHRTDKREFGMATIKSSSSSVLFGKNSDQTFNVWMSHGDSVSRLPEGFRVCAESDNAPLAAMENPKEKIFALQFHPEVTHTENGQTLLSRFVVDICDCDAFWDSSHIAEERIAWIARRVGDDEVVLGLSGGVDSSVVAALLQRAIGRQAICVFVDTGLLRLNEGDQVMETFANNLDMQVIRVDAKDRFYSALAGVSDPEEKRKVIGRVFIEVFEEQVASMPGVKWLAQGTIYPDVVESAATKTGKADVIKSHHNVGGLPEHMKLRLLEPIRELFKDEVRKLGKELGLPVKMLARHPFPGPGLGVRMLGEIKPEYVRSLQKADAIFLEILEKYDWYDRVSQAFAVFLPIQSVGVMGDQRRYEPVIALRAVETIDFMTATAARIPHEYLDEVARRIVNEVDGISRVVYDISGKPPATIEWE